MLIFRGVPKIARFFLGALSPPYLILSGICNNLSGQIIATSNDLTPNGGLAREISLFQGNLGEGEI